MKRHEIYATMLFLSFLFSGFSAYSQFAITSVNTDATSCNVGNGRIIVHTENRTGDVFFGLYNQPPFPPPMGLITYQTYTLDQDSVVFPEVAAGNYYVAVVDIGTSEVRGQWVNLAAVQTKVLTADPVTVVSGPTCFGGSDGVLQANASGGNPPYTYLWEPGFTTGQTKTGVGAGIYRVTVNDSYNCDTSSVSDNVESFAYTPAHPTYPDPLNGGTITASTTSVCFNGDPGVINNTTPPSGGTETFTYDWEFSTTGGAPWTSLGINAPSYDPPALTQTTHYRRVATDFCGTVYSNTVTITVNPLPVPTISGPATVCDESTGNVYTTESGMSNYVWSVSAGGTITSGGGAGDNSVTVTWNTPGPQTVSVNYTNGNGCTAASPTVYNITVNNLPSPALAGPTPVCTGTAGNVYTTDAGMTNYSWSVSAGGTITSGGGINDNTVTVTWNTSGPQTVSVNYTDANGCSALASTVFNVTVDPLPVPGLAGPTPVCEGSTGNVYTTDAGMSNYSWTVSPGGTITNGGGVNDNTVEVTWNAAGPQTVSINYTDANGCTGSAPTVYNVTVNSLPVPTISGPASACVNSTGNIYSTEAGMSNYVWSVSGGGTITNGGGVNDNTVEVTWNSTGPQTVTVSYTDANGCTAAAPVVYNVTVNSLPVPTIISGPTPVCVNTAGNVYVTEAGMSNYVWNVSAGGTITSGGGPGDNSVTVTWNTAGPQSVSVNYTNGNGCTGAAPTVYPVTVNPLPVPTIGGPTPVCVGDAGNVYTTEGGMSNYVWNVSAGGTITSGGGPGDNSVTVTWNTAGPQTVSVNYTNGNGCTASSATVYNVTVNPLPVPTIGGPTPVCVGDAGNVYTTEGGMSNYVWNVSAGGTITSGGGAGDNTVTVTWNASGPQTVSVSYTNANGCTAAAPTVYNVTVNALPTPTLSGPVSVCVNTSNVYTTEAGMSNYSWTIAPDGTITNGGGPGDNTVTVVWNTTGVKTIGVGYTDANGCTSGASGFLNVTVNPLPVPTIGGPNNVCEGSTGNVYTTEPGMSNYVWSVSAGGTITSGGGATDNSVEITWNTAGPQTVSVNYTNGNGCTGAASTVYNVNVNSLPVPALAGPNPVCRNSTGNVYTTDGGMSNYTWTVSPGGTITSGGGLNDNSVTVTWNNTGAQWVRVNYTDGNGCTASAPTQYDVTVNPLPVPTLSGPASTCLNEPGNVYTTEAGMTNYVWTVSAGGTITSGGGATDNSVEVTWNTVGPQTVRVSYTDGNGCTASVPTTYNVTVNPLPVPTILGPASACVGSTGNTYTTEGGMSNYTWTVSAGGTITSGGGVNDSSVEVTWNTAGPQTVTVNYVDGNGCTAASPVTYNITVNALPVPGIGGPVQACEGSTGNVYTTEGGMSNYVWNVSAGGTITSGGGPGDNSVTVTWNTAGPQTVSVSYTNANGCTAAAPTVLNITVDPLPVPTITGPASVCEGSTGNTYTTEAGMTGYIWSVSAGGTITNGGGVNDNTVEVTWNTAGPQTVSVNYTNANGCSAASPTIYNVTVNSLPVPTISGPASVCEGTAGHVYSTETGMTGYTWTVSAGGTITSGGGATDNSVTVTWNTAGPQTVSVNYTDPNGCSASAATVYNVTVGSNPTVTINPNPGTTCTNQNLAMSGFAAGGSGTYSSFVWSGTGAGYLNLTNIPFPTFNSPDAGSYGLTLTVTDDNGCVGSNTTTINVIAEPTANAGPDTSLCFGGVYQVVGADTTNSDGITWVTMGDGGFSNNTILNPVYTPGPNDIAAGSVKIVLRASGIGSCGNATDTAVITLPAPVQPLIGAPAPFLIGPDTEIEVCMSTTNHEYIEDLGFYLRTPDGQYFTLKRGILETSFFTPPCFNFFPNGNADNLCFTTELTLADTLDLCTEPLPVSGNFAATGDWTTLYGMNPAEAGWAIAINDTADFGTGGTDGEIISAEIHFIDTATATGRLTTVDYVSGPISEPIRDDRMNEVFIQRDLQVSCADECDAVALVNVTGGTPPYSNYIWDPAPFGGNGTDSVVLCAGTYNLTVVDANGCSGTASVNVLSPPVITIDELVYTDTLSCVGDSTGVIAAKASGGTGQLRYTLLPAIPSEVADSGYFSGLPAGTYTLHIEDARGCFLDSILVIREPAPLSLTSAVVTDSVFCTGDNNGRIVATASGGTQPYTFILEPLSLTNDSGIFENLAPGSYNILVTDANNCDTLTSDTLILGIPVPLAIDTVIVDSVICAGDPATFTVVVSGGEGPYDVYVDGLLEVSGIADTAIITRPAGSYDISIEDQNLCTDAWATITVSDPPVINIDAVVITDVDSCYNSPEGTITVTLSGGVPPYEFSIDSINYQPSGAFTNLIAGDYTIYYRDARGCQGTIPATVGGPPPIYGNIGPDDVVHVQGNSLGSIQVNPSGGTPYTVGEPYRYSLDGEPDPPGTESFFDSLDVGIYNVHVEDSLGCTWDTTIVIVELEIDVQITIREPECYGDATGRITFNSSDIVFPYNIYNLAAEDTIIDENVNYLPYIYNNVPADTFSLLIIDATGRTYDSTFVITQPPLLQPSTVVTQPTCGEFELDGSTSTNGTISISTTGGVGGYSYAWSHTTSIDSVQTGLGVDIYTVTITDDNECETVYAVNLTGEQVIDARIGIIPNPPGMEDFYRYYSDTTACYLEKFRLQVQHFESDVTYLWEPDTLLDDPNAADQGTVNFTVIGDYNYGVFVSTDQCYDYDEFEVNMFDTIGMRITTEVDERQRFGDTLTLPIESPVEIYSPSGYATYFWGASLDLFLANDPTEQNNILTPYGDGILFIFGSTFDGCLETDTAFVQILRPIMDVPTVFTPNNDGFNDWWQIANTVGKPDLEIFIFNRWGQQVFYSKSYGSDESNRWYGTSQKSGKDLPVGTYYYVIEPNDGEQEPITGTVTIVR